MLAEHRAGAADLGRRGLQAQWRAERADRPETGVLEVDEELAREEMWIVEDPAVVLDLAARDAGVAQEREPVRGGPRCGDLLDRKSVV